ncbi:hypothetical protein [Nodosilinea sp. P-1105]|uniref:hypothetical protein n=1 Tax=Nodosilinea sp. P-1105 TaxID=2546229 RepID=UPI00146BE8DD|nr:hypothetical protein [Nodosilinea sp. P-1105]NMF85859.1 hypothetical protein [Nodosilinea sp. P-1105]
MNRYVIGGILATLVMAIASGLGPIGFGEANDRSPRASTPEQEALGTRPIERAGQIVQRQSQANNAAVPITPDSALTDPQDIFSDLAEPTISPAPNNVIPQTGADTTASGFGDISPVQPDLVRPGVTAPSDDSDLDAIPALW